jgi:hypothetical protein
MLSVNNVQLVDIPSVYDSRGVLTSIESGMDIPISIERIFYMHHVSQDRGGHAHTDTDQVIIAISGDFQIELYDGTNKVVYKLNNPTSGLYVPKMIFIRLFDFSANAVCLVLANTHYDMKKSIRSLEDYEKNINQKI